MQFLNLATILALGSTVFAAPTSVSLIERAASNKQNFQVPTTNGLPGVDSPQVLQYILLGVGTQNYTCATPNSASAVPVAVGAVAKLYDMTKISDDPNGSKMVEYVPPSALIAYYANEFVMGALLSIAGYNKVVGDHYFSGGVPTFDLNKVGKGEIFRGKKAAGVAAPSNAFAGRGEGAVDWLKLVDAGTSNGIKTIFRVYTAGGKAPATCEKSPAAFTVKYATEYWLYA